MYCVGTVPPPRAVRCAVPWRPCESVPAIRCCVRFMLPRLWVVAMGGCYGWMLIGRCARFAASGLRRRPLPSHRCPQAASVLLSKGGPPLAAGAALTRGSPGTASRCLPGPRIHAFTHSLSCDASARRAQEPVRPWSPARHIMAPACPPGCGALGPRVVCKCERPTTHSDRRPLVGILRDLGGCHLCCLCSRRQFHVGRPPCVAAQEPACPPPPSRLPWFGKTQYNVQRG